MRVRSSLDNPGSYFASASYNDRADMLTVRLDGMSEAVQSIKIADDGITSISNYIEQIKGVISDALSTTDADNRRALGEQFNEMLVQVSSIAKDSSYSGINLLAGNDYMDVHFSERIGNSTLRVGGVNIQSGSKELGSNGELDASAVTYGEVVSDEFGVTSYVVSSYALTFDNWGDSVAGIKSAGESGDDWEIDWGSDDYQDQLTVLTKQVEKLQSSLKAMSSIYATDLSVITARQDFTTKMKTILKDGATALVGADLNEEAAKVTSLKTTVSLGVEALALSSQKSQIALQLIGG